MKGRPPPLRNVNPLPADLMPLNLINFFASTGAICGALIRYYSGRIFGSPGPGWHKTKRYREIGLRNGHGNGNGNGNGGGPQYIQGANGLYSCRLEEPHR